MSEKRAEKILDAAFLFPARNAHWNLGERSERRLGSKRRPIMPPHPNCKIKGTWTSRVNTRRINIWLAFFFFATVSCFGKDTSGSSKLLKAAPTSLSFGNITVGSSKTLSVTLTNTGKRSVTVSQVTVTGAGFSTQYQQAFAASHAHFRSKRILQWYLRSRHHG